MNARGWRKSFFAILLLLAMASSSVLAQTVSDEALKKISFDQKIGAQVSPQLQFRDENGKLIRLSDYLGKKPVILVMGYYGCPMLCTFVLNGMVGSLQDLKWDLGNQYEVIDVSIDPRESPTLAAAKKASYVHRYGRHNDGSGWHFLTGEKPAIKQLAGEVGFRYAYDARVNEFAHPSGLIILTPQGKVSHYLSGVVFSSKDLNDALVDASASKMGSPIQQLFLLCFHYSPLTGKYGKIVMLIVRVTGLAALIFVANCIRKAFRPSAVASPAKPKLQVERS